MLHGLPYILIQVKKRFEINPYRKSFVCYFANQFVLCIGVCSVLYKSLSAIIDSMEGMLSMVRFVTKPRKSLILVLCNGQYNFTNQQKIDSKLLGLRPFIMSIS